MVVMAKVNLELISFEQQSQPRETYWYSWRALEVIDMNEFVKTVMNMVLVSRVSLPAAQTEFARVPHRMMKWVMTRNRPKTVFPIQL